MQMLVVVRLGVGGIQIQLHQVLVGDTNTSHQLCSCVRHW